MKELVAFLLPCASFILWIGVVTPLAGRAFGVPARFGFWRIPRKNQHLGRWQYFWLFGMLGFAPGMFLLLTMKDYLQWKLIGHEYVYAFSARVLAGELVLSLAGGLAVGLCRPHQKSASDETEYTSLHLDR